MPERWPIEQRRAKLQGVVQSYARSGWLIQHQADTTAQLLKRAGKKSCLLIVVLLLLGIVPGILYLLWPSRDQALYIQVDEWGQVRTRYAKA